MLFETLELDINIQAFLVDDKNDLYILGVDVDDPSSEYLYYDRKLIKDKMGMSQSENSMNLLNYCDDGDDGFDSIYHNSMVNTLKIQELKFKYIFKILICHLSINNHLSLYKI